MSPIISFVAIFVADVTDGSQNLNTLQNFATRRGWLGPPTAGQIANGELHVLRRFCPRGGFLLLADDDLGIQPLLVKLLGGPGMQVPEEQLRQTNDANIPGFESHVHRFACGLPHDGRISTVPSCA